MFFCYRCTVDKQSILYSGMDCVQMQELDGWLAYRFMGPTPSSIGTKKKNGFGVAVFLIIVLLLLGSPHRPSLRQIFMFFIHILRLVQTREQTRSRLSMRFFTAFYMFEALRKVIGR